MEILAEKKKKPIVVNLLVVIVALAIIFMGLTSSPLDCLFGIFGGAMLGWISKDVSSTYQSNKFS